MKTHTIQTTLWGTAAALALLVAGCAPLTMKDGLVAQVAGYNAPVGDKTVPGFTFASSDAHFPHTLKTATVVFSTPVVGADNASKYTLSGTGAGTLAVTGATLDSLGTTATLTFSGAPSQGKLTLTVASSVVGKNGVSVSSTGATLDLDPNWYVSLTGVQGAAGTKLKPVPTIAEALAGAQADVAGLPNNSASVDVRVQAGAYPVSAGLDMGTSGNINLVGRWDSTFATHSAANGNTVITDSRTTGTGTVATLRASGIVDGLFIRGPNVGSLTNAAVYVTSMKTTVRNCQLFGAAGPNANNWVLYLNLDSAEGVKIYNNVIFAGGNASSSYLSYAIYISGTETAVTTRPLLANNLLTSYPTGGINGWAIGLGLNNWSIINNILYSHFSADYVTTGTHNGGITSIVAGKVPYQFNNNEFELDPNSNGNTAGNVGVWLNNGTSYYAPGGNGSFPSAMAVVGYPSSTASAGLTLAQLGNLATGSFSTNGYNNSWLSFQNPVVSRTDPSQDDWHLMSSAANSVVGYNKSVLTGGLDLSSYFTTDADGVTRTAANGTGWSMGPYEQDQ